MKKGIFTIISCVIVLAFCGCEDIERVNEELSSELSDMIASYENEQQTPSEESEQETEIAEIYYAYHKLDESEQILYRELFDALNMMAVLRAIRRKLL